MTRITLQTFDQVVESLDLAAGDSLLIGRRPNRGADQQALEVALASVSSNHVAVRIDGSHAHVTDLGSKNGTWLKLPANIPVGVPMSADVALYLSLPSATGAGDDLPADAAWSTPDEFAESVTRVVEDWLEQCGMPAKITLNERSHKHREADPGQIPLAVPVDVHVVPLHTTEARWSEVLGQLWRYIARQNDLFITEQELRQDGIVLAAPAMRRIYRSVIDAARRGLRLLLLGPSGAGKEVLARCYHRYSGRSGAFVARNCAMMSKEFLRAELFGAERGAFTGSVQRITGAVERAHGGTLFLDEIGELAPDVQAMLLRFLDSGEYERLGQFGSPSRADVRIVCATNKDLRAACARGEFRSDLWYRLSIQVIEVPPLRERIEDVIAYLKATTIAPSASAFDVLSPAALEVVRTHPWDGNFRELANFTERLPRDAEPGLVSADTCLRLLAQGALTPVRPRPVANTSDTGSWASSPRALRMHFARTTPTRRRRPGTT